MLSFSLPLSEALKASYDTTVSFYAKLLEISEPIQHRNKAGRNMQYLRLSLGSGTQLVNARTYQLHEKKNLKEGSSYLISNVSFTKTGTY